MKVSSCSLVEPHGLCVHTNTSCKFRLEGHLLLVVSLRSSFLSSPSTYSQPQLGTGTAQKDSLAVLCHPPRPSPHPAASGPRAIPGDPLHSPYHLFDQQVSSSGQSGPTPPSSLTASSPGPFRLLTSTIPPQPTPAHPPHLSHGLRNLHHSGYSHMDSI